MFESQRHKFVGENEYCGQCPQVASHWIHQEPVEKTNLPALVKLLDKQSFDHEDDWDDRDRRTLVKALANIEQRLKFLELK